MSVELGVRVDNKVFEHAQVGVSAATPRCTPQQSALNLPPPTPAAPDLALSKPKRMHGTINARSSGPMGIGIHAQPSPHAPRMLLGQHVTSWHAASSPCMRPSTQSVLERPLPRACTCAQRHATHAFATRQQQQLPLALGVHMCDCAMQRNAMRNATQCMHMLAAAGRL